ncbi:MAG: hypothetical protein CMC38_08385 [Flavobacteriaceae bacterium]|nr:hypothetical protein [Flavobacteriaceae bacterium]|tara:strand:- start:7059 stop:7460 length:402 start_codon:yes stop_codon:yes gene_type:complete
MLRNVSYKNSKIKDEINTAVGFPFSFFERIKMNGIGSKNLRIKSCSEEIKSILNLDNNDNKCNIEIRRQGIIVFFRSLLETYGLIIPFYKLKIFKGESNVYSIYSDKHLIKVFVKNKDDHKFFKKIIRYREIT